MSSRLSYEARTNITLTSRKAFGKTPGTAQGLLIHFNSARGSMCDWHAAAAATAAGVHAGAAHWQLGAHRQPTGPALGPVIATVPDWRGDGRRRRRLNGRLGQGRQAARAVAAPGPRRGPASESASGGASAPWHGGAGAAGQA